MLKVNLEDAEDIRKVLQKYGSNISVECNKDFMVVKHAGLSVGGLYLSVSNMMDYNKFLHIVKIDPTYSPDKLVASLFSPWLVSQAKKHGPDNVIQYSSQITQALQELVNSNKEHSINEFPSFIELINKEK